MAPLLKQNFDHYVSIMSLPNEQDPEEEADPDAEFDVIKVDQQVKKPDYSIYQ